MQMHFHIVKETRPGEHRVALVPSDAKQLIAAGLLRHSRHISVSIYNHIYHHKRS